MFIRELLFRILPVIQGPNAILVHLVIRLIKGVDGGIQLPDSCIEIIDINLGTTACRLVVECFF